MLFRYRLWAKHTCVSALAIVLSLSFAESAIAENWPSIPSEELSMTIEPQAPGASAILLYTQVDRNDSIGVEDVYARIKILGAGGRSWGNVRIAYQPRLDIIEGIQARTIQPDGRVITFSGTVHDEIVRETARDKTAMKVLPLSEVDIGSIVEYRYRRHYHKGIVADSQWTLNGPLFIKHGRYSLIPNPAYALRVGWPAELPTGTEAPVRHRGKFSMETHDVAALLMEENMPPVDQFSMRVEFDYDPSRDVEKDPEKYYKHRGKLTYDAVEHFVDRRRSMERALAEIIAPDDSPDEKLRKIYARVQAFRNATFERQKTVQEFRRDEASLPHDVDDMWKHGYGDTASINWLFLALARAAGFQADTVMVSTRDRYIFDPQFASARQLNSIVVVVKTDTGEQYFNPGIPYLPYGMLPWSETGVKGLKLDKEGGTWIQTPLTPTADSQTRRTARLKLQPDGSLTGMLTVTYTGLEAVWRRESALDEDAAQRQQALEEEIQRDSPQAIEITQVTSPDWDTVAPTLTATFKINIPGWAIAAGGKAALPASLFGARLKTAFQHGTRHYPIYVGWHFEMLDDVDVELPPGWSVAALPEMLDSSSALAGYRIRVESSPGRLHMERDFRIGFTVLEAKYYPALENFLDKVRAGDAEQAVVTLTARTQFTPQSVK